MLAVRSGPDAGAMYQLLPPRVTIGRDPATNNVVIGDPRVSRNAAMIEFAPDEILIHDVSGKGKLTVNGQAGDRQSIKGGDLIRIGDSEISFVVEALQLAPVPIVEIGNSADLALEGAPVVAAGQPSHQFPAPLGIGMPPALAPVMGGGANPRPSDRNNEPRPRKSKSKQSGRGPFYLVVGLIIGGIVYIGLSENGAKKLDRGLKSTSEIEKEIAETDARAAVVVKKRTFRTEEEKTRYEEAQRHYLEGFRDYQKGNFSRAMRSFETARAIDPEHQLALRYYRLAEKQRDEAITQLTLEGRRYREKDMFARCSSALEKALLLMPNKEDLKYKQAESMKKECDVLAESRF